ncbi:hypothetical protein [Micromonospora echinospora]|uniref:hypothetical protein n=1 Tax=Micromonospora echinospora TaxID=1877 RepID=UPI0035DE4216
MSALNPVTGYGAPAASTRRTSYPVTPASFHFWSGTTVTYRVTRSGSSATGTTG